VTLNSLNMSAGTPLAVAVGAIEKYIHSSNDGTSTATLIRSLDVKLTDLTEYVRKMADFALNAVAEFQNRGEHVQALAYTEQATRYEHLEYVLTHEAVRRDNAERLISGLRHVRRDVTRQSPVELHNKAEAKALLTSVYGEPHGSELLDSISSGLIQGKQRHTPIRNFVFTVERVQAETYRYSLAAPELYRGELKDAITGAINSVRDQFNQVSPDALVTKHNETNQHVTFTRVQESHTESRAVSMATATVTNPVKESVRKTKAISTPKVARATKAPAKSKADANAVEVAQPTPVEAATEVVAASPAEAVQTQTTEQNQEAGAEKHWTKWRESPEKLPATLEAQARTEYGAWAEKNADKAKEITFEKYRDFRIEQSIKKEAKVHDEVEQVAAAAGAPSEKSWRLQTGGYESLSESHKEQVRADLAKLIERDPKKSSLDIAKYCADVQEYCAKDKALAKTMLIDKTSVDRGAVNLSNSDHAHHFLTTIYKGERTGNDALGNLRSSVEKGSAKSIELKGAFTLTVERSKDDRVVRTSLQALPGKEAEVKRMFDDAASRAFRRAGITPQSKGREQTRKSNDLGR